MASFENDITGLNTEPDGRLVIRQGTHLIIVPTDKIDEMADKIKEHSGSEGDLDSWNIDIPYS